MKSFVLIGCLFLLVSVGEAQPRTRSTPLPAGVPVKPGTTIKPTAFSWDKGEISGRTYSNHSLDFAVTFPDTWLIPDEDFEAYMKSQGFDLSLKAPDELPVGSKAKVNAALKKVQVLMTAYRSMPGSADNAIVRISAEDLKANPQIKDAVDYVDAVRAMYAAMRLPADFKYSETQAEELPNKMQFAYLDTSSKEGKKRMYVTVRHDAAVLFTISYSKAGDLATLRDVLGSGDFRL